MDKQDFDLTARVAVVTGATGALGTSICRALARAGSDVVVVSRDRVKGDQLAESLKEEYAVKAVCITWEALDAKSIRQLAIQAKAWQGRVDILVNNAGGHLTTSSASFLDRSDEDIRHEIELNLISPLFCCREFGRIMKEQGQGKIINIASIAGMVGRDRRIYQSSGVNENLVDYAAAKGGVISMTRDLAALLSPYGVLVNAISPGGFRHGNTEEFAARYGALTPVGFMGRTASDLGGAVVFLASSASDYVTGQNLAVDGGFTIWR